MAEYEESGSFTLTERFRKYPVSLEQKSQEDWQGAADALAAYISSAPTENFQPMGANMGILPDLPERIRGKQEKYQAYADRGMAALEQALSEMEQV